MCRYGGDNIIINLTDIRCHFNEYALKDTAMDT
jgi:hypothetical protein